MDLVPWMYAALMLGGSGAVIVLSTREYPYIGQMNRAERLSLTFRMALGAFTSGFGSIGLLATQFGWSLAYSLLTALVFALIFARSAVAVMRYLMRQIPPDPASFADEIGVITDHLPPGMRGTARFHGHLYPVTAANPDAALASGTAVRIVSIASDHLIVESAEPEVIPPGTNGRNPVDR
ncbi:MAG: NfeD family protein [Chloroflexota bacterium]